MKEGLYIAFLPVSHVDGTVVKFDIFLVNTFEKLIAFSIEGKSGTRDFKSMQFEIGSGEIGVYDEIQFDELNDKPSFRCHINRQGTSVEHRLKVKASGFFKKKVFVPLLEAEAHLYLLINEHPDDYQPGSLVFAPAIRMPEAKGDFVDFNDIELSASLPGEIDLHIEKLTPEYQLLSNAEKMKLQLAVFESYLQQVLMSNLKEVFVVHGVGTGKLKSEIDLMMKDYPGVKSSEHRYYPKYGFGATKIILD